MTKSFLMVLLCVLNIFLLQVSYAREPAPVNENQLIEHRHYKNRGGVDVHSPAHSKDGMPPDGATAKCRDNTYSFSRSHRGTCSRHGGVMAWLNSSDRLDKK